MPEPLISDIDLSDNAFWALPPTQRHAAYARLRALDPPPFFEAGESPFGVPERGYYALVRHADVAEASRHPQLFSSAAGATSIFDLPPEFNEYFGSMINMDDPRHARLRRIVSRAFTPKMIKKFEEDVQRAASVIVDELLRNGPCDFVQAVSARLPLKIICDMMGIGDEHYEMVLRNTNIILAGADPEFMSEDMNEALTQILTSGGDLAALVTGLAEQRAAAPADDLVSSLVSANIDGEQLTPAELASFFILLVVAGNETTRNAISHALLLLTQHPDQRELLLADLDGADRARRGGDRPLRVPRHLDAPHADRGHRDERPRLPGQRQGAADVPGGEQGREPCSAPPPTSSTSPASPTRTSASAPRGRTSASARTWPAARSPPSCASC